jgi:hypothetical protein
MLRVANINKFKNKNFILAPFSKAVTHTQTYTLVYLHMYYVCICKQQTSMEIAKLSKQTLQSI